MNERPDIGQIKARLAAELLQLIGDADLQPPGDRAGAPKIDLARLRSGDLDDVSIEDLVAFLNLLDRHVAVTISAGVAEETHSLMERIAAITAAVPMHEWEKLPADFAVNHDHYLYGAPKRE